MISTPKINDEQVGIRLEALRIATGLRNDDFAATLHVDPSSWSKIKTGKKALHTTHAYACSVRWSVSMDYLFHGSLDKLPSQYSKKIIEHLTSLEE